MNLQRDKTEAYPMYYGHQKSYKYGASLLTVHAAWLK